MKVYLVNFIRGYWIGEFRSFDWSNIAPIISAVEPIDVRGIDANILHSYWDYLWRLGEYTFGARYVAGDRPSGGRLSLERFVEFAFLRLWPTYGRLWSAVGATRGWFDTADVVMSERIIGPGMTSRILAPYNIVLRYNEFLWWGRLIGRTAEDKPIYQQGPVIGAYLMFERRSKKKTPPKTDAWDFGMSWWEIFRVGTKMNVYLWAYGEAEYLGYGVRRSATTLTLR